jgi:SRSO17 transposase
LRADAEHDLTLLMRHGETADRWKSFLDGLGLKLRDKRQRASFAMYALGLLNDGERKSMEPIASRACGDPASTHAVHERLIHFLAASPWPDEPVRRYAARYAVDAMRRHGSIRTWIVDDTGFLKQGTLSPGVQRQYTGSAGKTTNCQIGVSLVVATEHAHVATDFRLYIPESWSEDRARCRRAYIPDDVYYEPKWSLALSMIENALDVGLPKGVVLADCDYGNKSVFRDTLTHLGLHYAVEIQSTTKMRLIAEDATPGERVAASDAARELRSDLRRITWREGSRKTLRSRYARVRVRVDGDDGVVREPEWLLVEWPDAEESPTKYILSTMPASVSCKELVRTFKERWRIERSYEDLKGELGLDHYEGRSFVGWHHHVSVVLACQAFLAAEHARAFPPSTQRQGRTGSIGDAA